MDKTNGQLTLGQIEGISSEAEHHRIAKVVKLAATQAEIQRLEVEVLIADKVEELAKAKAEALQLESELTSEGVTTRVSMAEYHHSVGLVVGRELWLSALPENLKDLEQKVITVSKVK